MRTSCSWAAITEASYIEWKDSISVCTSLTMSGKWSDFFTRNLMHWSRYPKASDRESRENSFLIKRRSSKPFDSVMPKAEIWLLIKFSILLYPVKFCWSKWKSLLLLMVWSWSLKDRIGSAELMASLSSGPYRHHESGIANLKTVPTNSWILIIPFLSMSNSSKMLWASMGSIFHPSSFLFSLRRYYLVHLIVMDHQLLVLHSYDSFPVPFESKDGSLHPDPQVTVRLDLQLLVVEVEVESELGLV